MEHADGASVSPAAEPRTPQPWAEILDLTFPHARPDTRRSLVTKADVLTFGPDQTMIPEGDETQVGLVLDGHVAVRRTTVDGHEIIPRIVDRGHMGAFLPIARRPVSAETLALSGCRVAVWHGDDVHALAAADAGFAIDLLGQVLRAFVEIVDSLDGLHYQNALRRVARVAASQPTTTDGTVRNMFLAPQAPLVQE